MNAFGTAISGRHGRRRRRWMGSYPGLSRREDCSQLYRLLTVNLPDEFRPGHVDGTVDGPRLGGAISGENQKKITPPI